MCECALSDFLLCSSDMCNPINSNPPPPRIYSPELLWKVNSDKSLPIPRDVCKKIYRLRIYSPRHKYENKIKTENPKTNTPENVNIKEKTVNITMVAHVRLGVMNVLSLGNKLDCVIDHITDNRLGIVEVTEIWLSNDECSVRLFCFVPGKNFM